MADPNTEADKRSISQELWETIETLSDDAQQMTLRKAKELVFDVDKGAIPFDETLINLTNNRNILRDAIERARLPQLPLKIQKTLLADARRVSLHLTAIANGTDAIIPLESAVEDLTASVWYSRLQNLTGSILGFQKKVNQLKTLESSLSAAKRQAEDFAPKEERAREIISKIETLSEVAFKTTTKINETVVEAEKVASRMKEAEQQADASLAIVAQGVKTANDGAATIGVHASETEASTNRVKDLLSQSEALLASYKSLEEGMKTLATSTEATLTASQSSHENQLALLEKNVKAASEALRTSTTDAVEAMKAEAAAKITAALTNIQTETSTLVSSLQEAEADRADRAKAQLVSSNDAFVSAANSAKESYNANFALLDAKAKKIIEDNNSELNKLTTNLNDLEAIIHEKIQLATNFQLFHSFQTRQLTIAKSKRFWAWALAGCVAISLIASAIFIWHLQYVQVYNAAFYLKLSISLPIVYAITFCSLQFSRERRLEEEYAFKSNISISLDPYRKLVAELVDTENPVEMAKYSDFVIESINKVFTSPTTHSFDEKPSNDDATGIIKELGNLITPIVKAIRG